MEKEFLCRLSEHIIQKYPDNYSDICIVLPNKRAQLFLKKKYLKKAIKTNSFVPEIYSLEDFAQKLSGLNKADHSVLLFELYRVYQQIEKDKSQSFEDFSSWGTILLSDYNEIDLSMADPEQIFHHLKDTKEIETWQLDSDTHSESQLEYISFFASLFSYYEQFKANILEDNLSYKGLIYRTLCERIEKEEIKIPFENIVFAGFNALTKSEERLIALLRERAHVEMLWDADIYYMENNLQESGLFLRKYKEKEAIFNWIGDSFRDKEIQISGVPTAVGQVQHCAHILKALLDKGENIEDILIVLAEETLLIPLINVLPKEIEHFNVTMSLPQDMNPFHDLVSRLIAIDINIRKIMPSEADKGKMYYKDVIAFFNHPVFKNASKAILFQQIIDKINRENMIFLRLDDLSQNKELESIFGILHQKVSTAYDLIEKIDLLLRYMKDSPLLEIDTHELNIEFLFSYFKIISRLKSLVGEYSFIKTSDELKLILNDIVRNSKIDFFGEPLQGLQVMGLLETRNLDFKNVIILSVNEGVLPSPKSQNSFIPFDIKKAHGLQTNKESKSVFSYHFYRLLQKAKHVNLLYAIDNDSVNKNEKSRYIYQLMQELNGKNNVHIEENIVRIPFQFFNTKRKEFPKNEIILKKVQERLEQGISPSALNMYLNCSMQYFYHYILRIKPKEEVSEELEASNIGDVLHEILEDIFREAKADDKSVLQLLTAYKKNIPEMVLNYFKKAFYQEGKKVPDIAKYGKNRLKIKMTEYMLEEFFKFEINRLKNNPNVQFLSVEEELSATLSANGTRVLLKGKADRIDYQDGNYVVIDYKSGKVSSKDLEIKEMEDLISGKKPKALQLMLYALMYNASEEKPFGQQQVVSGNYSFKNLRNGLLKLNILGNQELDESIFDEFKLVLQDLFEEMLSSEIPFKATEDVNKCKYCNYFDVCN